MERHHYYEAFPEKGHTTERSGFGGAVSVLIFRFDLWLKGDPIRQIRKCFERDEDEEFPSHSAHYQHARRKTKTHLSSAKRDNKRSPGRGGIRRPSMPSVASPTPPSTRPALTPAAAAATILKALHAKRGEDPEWNTGWAEWEALHNRRKESEDQQANNTIANKMNVDETVPASPFSPRTPLRMPTTVPRQKRGERQEDGFPTPPVSPPSSRSRSELAPIFPWALSPQPTPLPPWASKLHYF